MTLLIALAFLAKWTAASLAATALWAIAGLRISQACQQPSREFPKRDEFKQVQHNWGYK